MENRQRFDDDMIASIDRQRRLLAQLIREHGPRGPAAEFTGEVVGKVRSFSGTSYLTLVGPESDIEVRTPDRFVPQRTRQGHVLCVQARRRYEPYDRNPVWQVDPQDPQHHGSPCIVRVAPKGPFALRRERTAREFQLPEKPNSKLEGLELPSKIRRIALISGHQSQVTQDFKNTVGAKYDTGLAIVSYSGGVQRRGAASSIIRSISAENAKDAAHRADLIVIMRGGGSYADFLLFDDPMLVQHIVGSRIPVATAVGHIEHQPLAARAAAVNFDVPAVAGAQIKDYNARNATRKFPSYRESVLTADELSTRASRLSRENQRLHQELDKVREEVDEGRGTIEALHGESRDLRQANEQVLAQAAAMMACRIHEARQAAQLRVEYKALVNGLWWTLWAVLVTAGVVFAHLPMLVMALWVIGPAGWALLTFSGGARTARFLRTHPTPLHRVPDPERFIVHPATALNPRQVRQAVRRSESGAHVEGQW